MKEEIFVIDLQLHAIDGVHTTGTEGMSPEMKTHYDRTLIDEAGPYLVHQQFGQKRPIPQRGGKSIEFRRFNPLAKAMTPITEGVTPEPGDVAVDRITATVGHYGSFLAWSDVLELTAIDPVVVEFTKLNGQQAGRTLDSVVRDAIHEGITSVTFCPKLGADGSETAVTEESGLDTTCRFTVDVVQQVVAKLRAQNAPTVNGDYIGIIHPYVAYDLMHDPAWREWNKYTTPEAMYEGEIGKIGGVRFVQTSEAKITTGSKGAIFHTLIFGDEAYGVTEVTGGGLQTIIKQLGSGGTEDPLNQRATVGWKALLTAELLVPQYIDCVMSMSDRFSAGTAAN